MSRRSPLSVIAAAGIALALLLSGCSATGDSTKAPPAAGDTFPVSIPNAFGTTTIKKAPKRVVAWGFGSADAAIALGVIPVAMPFQSYGGNKQGVLPWIAAALKKDGAKTPTVLPNSSDDPPYEAIAAAKPDVILAPYSGITKQQYTTLSKIAPVVGYPKAAWTTPWQDVITLVGKALGRSARAAELVKSINASIAAEAAKHPEFKGKTVAEVWDSAGTFYVYKKQDPRVQFTEALGFTSAPSVAALSGGGSTFYYTLSYEKLDQLKSDVLVSFSTTKAESEAFLHEGYAQVMPQVKDGAVATPVGTAFIASVSPPTALSLTWGLKDYVATLAKAVKAADAAK